MEWDWWDYLGRALIVLVFVIICASHDRID